MSDHDEILGRQVAEAFERVKSSTLDPVEIRLAALENAMQEDGARLDALEANMKAMNEAFLRFTLNASVALAKQGD